MKQKEKLLVVDDDPNLRRTLADILKVKGYEAVVASTGAEAIAAAEHETFSLALIDLMLPDMPGLAVMERIKAISPLTEAIILTGHASMDSAIEATNKGAFSYLLKPYQMDDLLRNIRHGVERQQAQEEILRLASHPRLNPNPVIELSPSGEVTYVNPAAEKLFPDLSAKGLAHPMLDGLEQLLPAVRQSRQLEILRELVIAEATYEQHLSYIEEVDLVRIYARDITRRKQAEHALAAREREQAAVAELGTLALSGLDLPAVFKKAAALTSHALGMEYCMVLELLPEKDALLLQAGTGWDAALYGKERFEANAASLMGYALTSSDPVSFVNLHEETRFAVPSLLERHGAISGLCSAISFRENPFGVLCVFETRPREFSKDDTHFLQAVCNVLAAAAQRTRADEEIHLLATTDSLTGIANRREFTSILENEMTRAKRYTTPLSLVMYDLDHFKEVNDAYGHDVGDHVLQAVTGLVQGNIRSIDFQARWGGEEFMILMPQSDILAAKTAAEKLRLAIANHRFEKVERMSVSFGVTAFAPQDDINSLLKRVDDALYKAKGAGRNSVESLAREPDMTDRAAGAA